ncbi:MAG: 2-succinyl-5-enolpyruvyl-6-hydroxy-3-cyclohexene-1-carboxylic-acid synthase [Acidimicrobiales bacterium]
MPQSVPSPSEVQATYAATLFDQWIADGLRDVVVCPGSRSTPLALACAARSELRVHVRIDERSAGFFALGRALVTHTPVAVVVTSGTAAAELHACVAEASQAFVPLLIVTADRPPELHGVGAPQTIDQHELFGDMVRRFEDPGVARVDAKGTWRQLADRLWRHATHGTATFPNAGPVHLNAAFIEPLVAPPFALPAPEASAWTSRDVDAGHVALEDLRVLCVAGHGVTAQTVEDCSALNWAVVGDATALGTIAYFDALLRDDEFAEQVRPDVVVRLGGIPASRILQERLREWKVRTIGFNGAGFLSDPDRLVGERFDGLPDPVQEPKADGDYLRLWSDASTLVGEWLATLDGDVALHEPAVARCVVATSSRRAVPLVVGSSMPVRDVEWWTPPRTAPTFSNRGVNGIDGVVSTALGVASDASAIGFVGDITMLHDVSALVDGLGDVGGTCALVVADNHGGGIFSFLSQRTSVGDTEFEQLFGTPRQHDLVEVAKSFGHRAVRVTTVPYLHAALEEALDIPGLTVIVADVPSRDENVRLHDEWNVKVKSILEGVR